MINNVFQRLGQTKRKQNSFLNYQRRMLWSFFLLRSLLCCLVLCCLVLCCLVSSDCVAFVRSVEFWDPSPLPVQTPPFCPFFLGRANHNNSKQTPKTPFFVLRGRHFLTDATTHLFFVCLFVFWFVSLTHFSLLLDSDFKHQASACV